MRMKLHSRDYEFLQKWCDEHDKYCWMKTNKHGDEKIETHGYEERKKYLEEAGILAKEAKDEYLEYVEKKYDEDDEVNQEASIDFDKVGQLKSNPVSDDKFLSWQKECLSEVKLKEIMKFSKDFGLDATTKVLEVLNQYKDEEKDEEKPADITPLNRFKILMRSSIEAIEHANDIRLGLIEERIPVLLRHENQIKTKISIALQDLEDFTEETRLNFELFEN